MKCVIATFVALAGFCCVPGLTMAQTPHQVGGFTLHTDIQGYADQVVLNSALPVRFAEFLQEVEIKPNAAYRSGLIAYGACAKPGNIVRIKLKYADSSKAFFNELLTRFKKSFGDPSDYRGDPFHILIAWKWSFVDADQNKISLILQHNTQDDEEKIGNAVKMTLTSQMDQEQRCYEQKHAPSDPAAGSSTAVKGGKSQWELLIPR
jgi:hypothetical protein